MVMLKLIITINFLRARKLMVLRYLVVMSKLEEKCHHKKYHLTEFCLKEESCHQHLLLMLLR